MKLKKKILLIEDHAEIARVHEIIIKKLDFDVDIAITGEQAIEKFVNYRYPLVMLDGGLPDMTGLDLALRMREYEQSTNISRTPLIILSGYLEEDIKEWCRVGDIDNYAIKPVSPELLKVLINKYIDNAQYSS